MIQAIIPALAPVLTKIVGNLFPDPTEKAKAEAEMMRQLLAHQGELESAAAKIIQTEAASSHWLAANWRPLTMLTFVVLIVARWFGWAAPNLSEAEYIKLWSIVEFGLGGYVVGRSVEKIAPSIAKAMRKD
ncbi:MAG: 3TM-type holin [Synechococcus sp.]|nr:3TM-type holin [Synechococcus sp.]